MSMINFFSDAIGVSRKFMKAAIFEGKLSEFAGIFSKILVSGKSPLLSKFKYSILFFNKLHDARYNLFFESVLSQYKKLGWKASSILDLACGFGDFYYFLKRINPDLIYEGVDLSDGYKPVWNFIAKEKDNIAFHNYDILQFARKPLDKFDLIICLNAIIYLKNYWDFLKNLLDNSKKGTSYIISFSKTSRKIQSLNKDKHGIANIKPETFQKRLRIWDLL